MIESLSEDLEAARIALYGDKEMPLTAETLKRLVEASAAHPRPSYYWVLRFSKELTDEVARMDPFCSPERQLEFGIKDLIITIVRLMVSAIDRQETNLLQGLHDLVSQFVLEVQDLVRTGQIGRVEELNMKILLLSEKVERYEKMLGIGPIEEGERFEGV